MNIQVKEIKNEIPEFKNEPPKPQDDVVELPRVELPQNELQFEEPPPQTEEEYKIAEEPKVECKKNKLFGSLRPATAKPEKRDSVFKNVAIGMMVVGLVAKLI